MAIGKYGSFNPPRYPFRMRLLGIGLGAVAWMWYLGAAKEMAAYQFGFRTPWDDHAPDPAYLQHHETAWRDPSSASAASSTEDDGDDERE